MVRGHYQTAQVIMDDNGKIYDPREFRVCELCGEITPRNELRGAMNKYMQQNMLVCNKCFNSSPMIERA